MGDSTEAREPSHKKRKGKWVTSYSAMSVREAEKRLGLSCNDITPCLLLRYIVSNTTYEVEGVDVKARVYERILELLQIEVYPDETNPYFGQANASVLGLRYYRPNRRLYADGNGTPYNTLN